MYKPSYLLLGIVLFLSCRREAPVWEENGPYVEITLSTDRASVMEQTTKSEGSYPVEGIDQRLHENLISTIDFFFYPGGNTSSNAAYYIRKESGKTKTDVIRLGFTSAEINTLLFPSQQDVETCYVFAVVNYSGEDPLVVPEVDQEGKIISYPNSSLTEIQGKEVLTNFITPGGDKKEHPETSHYHSNFLMSGGTTLSLRGRNQTLSASGSIELKRFASKMTVGVSVVQQVLVGNEVWEPRLESMELYLVDCVQNVTLGGRTMSPSYFSFYSNPMKFINTQTGEPLVDKYGDYYNTYPFYMYPQKWTYGSSISPNKEPYLKLVLPWQQVNGDHTQKQFYYKIVIPDDNREEYICQFVRNNWYHINVNVSILGAETDEEAVPAPVSVFVVPWQDKNVVVKNAEIGKARYLSVDKDTLLVRNISDSLGIAYTSSHPVEITNVRATRAYYGESTSGSGPGDKGVIHKAVAGDSHGYKVNTYYLDYPLQQRLDINNHKHGNDKVDWVYVAPYESTVYFQHTLNNDYTKSDFDYSPYIITFTLQHEDDVSYQQDVTVIQYPGIFIEALYNSDYVNYKTLEGKDVAPGRVAHNGFVFVDGAQYLRTKTNDLFNDKTSYDIIAKWYNQEKGYSHNLSANGGATRTIPELEDLQWRMVNYTGGSKVIFQIDVSVLPDHSDFVIGDPRVSEVNNLTDNHFHGSPSSDDGAEIPSSPATPLNNIWSKPAWETVNALYPKEDKEGSPLTQPVEAFVPYSWPTERGASWSVAPGIEGTVSRTLQHYYPADPSERTANLMAPSYRIASKFGGIEYYDGISYKLAQFRCASYQEDGYPAGRWRLPTRGEIRFIAMLSAKGAFTYLFSTGSYYWSANGAVQVTNGDVTDQPNRNYALARCVYDTWYWGEEDRLKEEDRGTFTWGDKER